MKILRSKELSSNADLFHGFVYDFDNDIDSLAKKIGLKRINTVKQIHSNKVAYFKNDKNYKITREADALVSLSPGIGVGVNTADCVPILFYSQQKRISGAIHAGWRGTLSEISSNTIKSLNDQFEGISDDIVSIIGPCIGNCCYEVSQDVSNSFASKFSDSDKFLNKIAEDKFILDLKLANYIQLMNAGIKEIIDLDICTKCNSDFPSYRREGNKAGRMLSFIGYI